MRKESAKAGSYFWLKENLLSIMLLE